MTAPPFGDIQPVELPFSGTTDAKGIFVFTSQIRAAFWSLVKCTGFASGNPVWLMEVGGNPDSIGLGAQTGLGPAIVGPGEKVTLTISGAIPNSSVRGAFSGVQGPLSNLVRMYAPTPNLISVQQSAPQLLLDTITITTDNQFVMHTGIPVPLGTHAIALVTTVPTTTSSNVASLIVNGEQSSSFYLNPAIPAQMSVPVYSPVLSSVDTSLSFQVQATNPASNTPFKVFLVALLDPLSVANIQQGVSQVKIQDSFSKVIGGFTEADGIHEDLAVSFQGANPAPWQAAKKVITLNASVAAGGTNVQIAAVVGQTIYLFSMAWTAGGSGNQFGKFEDTSGVEFASYAYNTAAPFAPPPLLFNGAPLPVGRGLQIHNLAAVASTFNGAIAYSQQ